MKTQRLFSVCLLVATIVLCMNGCSDDDEIDPIGWVRLEQSSFEISGEAQTITVTLEVNNVPVVTDIQWMYPWITSCKKIEAVEGKNTSKEKYKNLGRVCKGYYAEIVFWFVYLFIG